MLLHLTPVLNSPAGLPMMVALAALCWLTPVTGFYFIACAQFLPDPTNGAMVPAAIGFYTWLLVTPLRYRGFRLRGVSILLLLLPYFLLVSVLSGDLGVFAINGNWAKAIAYAVMACQLANESRGKYHQCLWGLCVGALMIGAAFWASQVGLPVILADLDGERAGFTRTGGVRVNSVMMWPPALMALAGFGGLAFLSLSRSRERRASRRTVLFLVAVVLFLLPPLLVSMTMTAYAGFALFLGLLVLVAAHLAATHVLQRPTFRLVLLWTGLTGVLIGSVFALDIFQARSRTVAYWDYYQESKANGEVLASRTGTWVASWQTIGRYPWLGVQFSHGAEVVPDEYANFYADNGYYLSHNVFLDTWRGGGLAGLLLFSLFFFYPLWKHLVSEGRLSRLPFVLVFAAVVLFYMMLSFAFYKTVWAFWMLMTKATDSPPMRNAVLRYLKLEPRRDWHEAPVGLSPHARGLPEKMPLRSAGLVRNVGQHCTEDPPLGTLGTETAHD